MEVDDAWRAMHTRYMNNADTITATWFVNGYGWTTGTFHDCTPDMVRAVITRNRGTHITLN